MTTSRFLTGGRTRLIGTSLGSPGAGELPNSAMYWDGHTAGWDSGDLAGYNKWKLLTGRKPDVVRLYSTNAFATTGVTGSAGNYGMFSADWRSIANDGAILLITYTDSAESWATMATNLAAAGSNATKTRYLNLIQNLKRWHDDTGNTAAVKSLLFGQKHEPSNDGGVAADYKAYYQAAVNFFLDNGIGDGPKPSSGHGSTYAGTWYDMVEWAYVDIGFNFANGTATNTYGGNYYPGDGFVRWVFFDVYGWGGGQGPGGGQALTDAKAGQVPQPGRTITAGHYNDAWKPLRDVLQNPLDWVHLNTSRPVLYGLGEFAMSEDIDRFTISGGSLANPQTHTGDPHMKADWFKGALAYFRGEAFTVAGGHNNINNVPADAEGLLFVAPIHWNSQAALPRWWNTIPFQTGDTTGPTTAGAGAHETFDAAVALFNDSIFTTTPVIHTPPVGGYTWRVQDGGQAGDMQFDATITAHDGAIVSYAWDPGDGSGLITHTSAALIDQFLHSYANSGLFNSTLTVTDANALTLLVAHQVVVVPATSGLSGAPLIKPGDKVLDARTTINTAINDLEAYTAVQNGTRVVATSGAAQTLADARAWRFQDITLTANCTITLPASPTVGMLMRVIVRQDATGARTVTWAHGSAIKWPVATAPVQTVTASTSDEYEFECVTAGTWRGRRVVADVR